MNKKCVMGSFVNGINDSGLMTKFIKNIFNYDCLNDYNYIFRMIDNDNEIIIDIYDNVSETRFNRYVFSFIEKEYDVKLIKEDDLFVTYMCVLNMDDSDNKLLKLAYLFKIDNNLMEEYADSFLDDEFINILRNIIK